MKKKKIIISAAVGLLSMMILTSTVGAKFHGGSVIDVARVAKEAQKVIEDTNILTEITKIKALQEEFFSHFEELAMFKDDVQSIVKEANILSGSVNGLIDSGNTYKEKVENLYSIDFLDGKHGNTPEAWKANRERLTEAYENEYKNSVDVVQKSEDVGSRIERQREKIMYKYTKGVISETQKGLLLKALLVTSKNTHGMLNNQVMVNAITEDMQARTKEKLADAQCQYHSFGFIDADDPKHIQAIEENKITELPR